MSKSFTSISDLFDTMDERLETVFKKTSNGSKIPEKLSEELRLFYVNTVLFLSDLSLEDAPLKAQEIYDYAIQAARDENMKLKSQISLHGNELVRADPVFQEGHYESISTEYAVLVHKLESLNSRKNTSESEITKLTEENQELTKAIEDIVTARENDTEKSPVQKEFQRVKVQIELYEQEIKAISRSLYVSTSQNNKEIEKLSKEVEEMESYDKTLDRRIKYSCGGKTKSHLEPSVPSKRIKSTRVQKSPKKSPSPRKKGRNKSPSKTKKVGVVPSPEENLNPALDLDSQCTPESPTKKDNVISSSKKDSNLSVDINSLLSPDTPTKNESGTSSPENDSNLQVSLDLPVRKENEPSSPDIESKLSVDINSKISPSSPIETEIRPSSLEKDSNFKISIDSSTKTDSGLSSPSRNGSVKDSNLQTEHFIVAQRLPPVNV